LYSSLREPHAATGTFTCSSGYAILYLEIEKVGLYLLNGVVSVDLKADRLGTALLPLNNNITKDNRVHYFTGPPKREHIVMDF
jgi:hypothetical protein